MQTTRDCPSCARKLNLPDELRGQSVQCPGCGMVFLPDTQPAVATLALSAPLEKAVPLSEALRSEWPSPESSKAITSRSETPRPGTVARVLPQSPLVLPSHGDLFGYRGTAAILTLVVCLLAECLSVAIDFAHLNLAERESQGLIISAKEQWHSATLTTFNHVFRLATTVTAAVAFCMWMYRAYDNLPLLRSPGLQYSPTWAAGAFFVPILNLFRPYQIAQELWKASDPVMPLRSRAWRESSSSAIVAGWWGAWLGGRLIGVLSGRVSLLEPSTLDALEAAVTLRTLAAVILLVAAVCAIRMIRQIQQRQVQRLRRVLEESRLPPTARRREC